MVGRGSEIIDMTILSFATIAAVTTVATVAIWMKVGHGTLFFGNAAEFFKRLLECMTKR